MSLILGTHDGIYRYDPDTNSIIQKVLDAGDTLHVTVSDGEEIFAAAKTGLYRSRDEGKSWRYIKTPRPEVYSFAVSPDKYRWYAGTHPAHIYTSDDEGQTWWELDAFQQLPSRPEWGTPRHRGSAHVRSIGVHPSSLGLVVAGVEVGGIHVSRDYGGTWDERRDGVPVERTDGLQFDVHHVQVLEEDEFVISCGGGVYHTRNAGGNWNQLNPDDKRSYATSSCFLNSTLYLSLQSLPPYLPFGNRRRGANGALWATTNMGRSFQREHYPGEPDDYIYAWAVAGDSVLAGTTGGRILVRESHGWELLAQVPEWIRSMAWV